MHPQFIIEKGASLDKASAALILLHGRGASAEDIISLADELVDNSYYICAPEASGNTWYPYSFLMPVAMNEPWLTSAIEAVKRIIDKIAVKIPTNRIFIAGFSQGACLALETTARYPSKYGGVAAFSGGLIGKDLELNKYSGNFEGTRIFIGNGDDDPHIPEDRCSESADILKKLGANVTLNIYPEIGHTIIPQEIKTVKELIFA